MYSSKEALCIGGPHEPMNRPTGDSPSDKKPVWKAADVGYTAGSSTCVISFPPNRNELGTTEHAIEISNRRFREDEFLIPRRLSRRRSAIRVPIQFTPVNVPLHPGADVSELKWRTIHYSAHSFVLPKFTPAPPSV
jgi:hypothetical protein